MGANPVLALALLSQQRIVYDARLTIEMPIPDIVETILVVDDDELVRHLAAQILQKHGYSVIEADSGSDGLERFSKHHNEVDLVLSDVVMPEMSGTEMVQRILTIKPAMRVLMMSGYAVEPILPKTVPLVSKPFTLEILVETVKACLAA